MNIEQQTNTFDIIQRHTITLFAKGYAPKAFCHVCETFYTIAQSKSNIPVRDHKMLGGRSKEKFGGSGGSAN